MRYLLDTPALLDLVAGDRAAVELMRGLLADDADLMTTAIVAAEAVVLAGSIHAGTVGGLLAALDIVPLGGEAALDAARIVVGTPTRVPLGDALVAAQARLLGAVVVTRDRPAIESAGANVVGY